MTNIFIDTSAFIALLRTEDDRHVRAESRLKGFGDGGIRWVTTDYVASETYTTLLGREGYRMAMEFDRQLQLGGWQMEWIDKARFVKAQEVFRRFNKDKRWSFTDCSSYVVMKELKIKQAFAFDEHFRQMGFELL